MPVFIGSDGESTAIDRPSSILGDDFVTDVRHDSTLNYTLPVGSQPARFDRAATGCGIVGPKAVTVINQTAYWVDTDLKVRRWTPGDVPVQLPCPISRDLVVPSPALAAKIVVGTVGKFGEVWIFYPAAIDGATENSRYIAVSLLTGAWFKGAMARTCFVDDAELATVLGAVGVSTTILAADANFRIQMHEDATTTNADVNGAVSWHIQSADQYIESGRRRVMIHRMVPDFEVAPDGNLTIFVRRFPKSFPTTKGPYEITSSTKKIDFRASGNLISFRFSDNGTVSTMRLGKPRLDGVVLGER